MNTVDIKKKKYCHEEFDNLQEQMTIKNYAYFSKEMSVV